MLTYIISFRAAWIWLLNCDLPTKVLSSSKSCRVQGRRHEKAQAACRRHQSPRDHVKQGGLMIGQTLCCN